MASDEAVYNAHLPFLTGFTLSRGPLLLVVRKLSGIYYTAIPGLPSVGQGKTALDAMLALDLNTGRWATDLIARANAGPLDDRDEILLRFFTLLVTGDDTMTFLDSEKETP